MKTERHFNSILLLLILITAIYGQLFSFDYHQFSSTFKLAYPHYKILNSSNPDHKQIYYKNKAVVLLYHDIGTKENGVTITKTRFVNHMKMLEQEGFNVVSLDDIVAFIKENQELPCNAVAITFDDGCESNYTVAHQILTAKGWPYTVFITTSDIGKMRPTGSFRLSARQLAKMSANGVIIGGHTNNGHYYIADGSGQRRPWLTGRFREESVNRYQNRIFQDLYQSKQILDKITGKPTWHFAPPYGIYNVSVAKQAQRAGFKFVWSTRRIPVKANSSLTGLGRVSVGRAGTSAESLKSTILLTAKK